MSDHRLGRADAVSAADGWAVAGNAGGGDSGGTASARTPEGCRGGLVQQAVDMGVAVVQDCGDEFESGTGQGLGELCCQN